MIGTLRKRLFIIAVALSVLGFLPISAIVPPAEAASTYNARAKKVSVNLTSRHNTYGVFLIPAGHQANSLRLHFYDPKTRLLVQNAGSATCGSAGPGGTLEGVKVPSGYIGIRGCMHTTVAWGIYMSAARSALYDPNSWILEYRR